MPHIQQLSSHVADLIAAGEVVERPASVVKELVENAIDAGASAIVVEIQRGGMGLIRVTDNGCGIAPEELPTAFLRHATSKLRTEKDLSCIGGNGEFIKLSYLHTCIKILPDTGLSYFGHRIGFRVPAVEIAYQVDCLCMWCPYAKINALFAFIGHRMSAQLFIDLVVSTCAE